MGRIAVDVLRIYSVYYNDKEANKTGTDKTY